MTKLNKLLLALLIFSVLIFLFGFIRYFFSIKNFETSINVNAQGIAVLTGGKGRIAEAIKVFRENSLSYLLISGVDKSVRIEDIVPEDFLTNPRVSIDKNSQTTLDNANEIIKWSNRNSIKNIIIITSDYHIPRSMLILTNRGKGLAFYPHPVASSIDFEKNLLKDTKILKFLLEEYVKYLLSFFV